MKNRAEFAVIWTVVTMIRVLPLSWARRLADGLAVVLRDWIGIRREVVEENIQRAFPDYTGEKRSKIASECYRFYARAGVDWLKTEAVLDEETITIEGEERLERMNDEGGIIVSGHLGYWELSGVIVADRVDRLLVYADEQSNPYSERMIRRMRSSHGIETDNGMTGVRKLSEVAREGNVSAVVGDQRPRNRAEYVPFFGRNVKNTKILSFVARQSRKPVYPIACRRISSGTIEFLIDEPLPASLDEVTSDNRRQLLTQYNQWLEERIKETPEQYFWLHKRWKDSRPLDGSTDEDTVASA